MVGSKIRWKGLLIRNNDQTVREPRGAKTTSLQGNGNILNEEEPLKSSGWSQMRRRVVQPSHPEESIVRLTAETVKQ